MSINKNIYEKPPLIRKDGHTDGRSMRRTGRNALLGVRVTKDFRELVKQVAAREGRPIGAVLEAAVRSYLRRNKNSDPSLG